jgi:hypothetical protein
MKRSVGRVALPLTALASAFVAWLVVTAPAHPQAAAPGSASLRVVAEYDVPATPSVATSVRWASDHSVYLARLLHGVFEVALDNSLSQTHVILPDAKTMKVHFTTFSRLAVSSEYIAASSLVFDFAFRPVAVAAQGNFPVRRLSMGIPYAYDLSGDRLLLVGDPDFGPQLSAGVVWLGSLNPYSRKDLHPLLTDAAAGGRTKTPALINCQMVQLGAARFLPGGSFLVVPGFQSGVHLYNAAAQLVRTWQNEDLGFDAPDCAGMSPQEEERYRAWPPAKFDFLNRYQIVDEILPLSWGSGLVIRSVADGRVSWVLRVLRADGTVHTFNVPLTSTQTSDRLHGDVLGDRIVLLRTGFSAAKEVPDPPGKLYVVEVPQAPSEPAR